MEQLIVLLSLAGFAFAVSVTVQAAHPPVVSDQQGEVLPFSAQFWSAMSFMFPCASVSCSTTEHIGWPIESFWSFPVMQGGVMSAPSLVAMAVMEAA